MHRMFLRIFDSNIPLKWINIFIIFLCILKTEEHVASGLLYLTFPNWTYAFKSELISSEDSLAKNL